MSDGIPALSEPDLQINTQTYSVIATQSCRTRPNGKVTHDKQTNQQLTRASLDHCFLSPWLSSWVNVTVMRFSGMLMVLHCIYTLLCVTHSGAHSVTSQHHQTTHKITTKMKRDHFTAFTAFSLSLHSLLKCQIINKSGIKRIVRSIIKKLFSCCYPISKQIEDFNLSNPVFNFGKFFWTKSCYRRLE